MCVSFNSELYTTLFVCMCVFARVCVHACLVLQVVQPVMWRGAVLAERANIMLHARQCTSHQVSETANLNPALPLLCLFVSSFCLLVQNRNKVPLFYMTLCRHIVDEKQVGFKERVLLRVCYSMCVSENNLGLKYPACHRGSLEANHGS